MSLKVPMKALSIKQPWAWLIVNGHKDIENRDWPTRLTGPIAIHAGKTFDRAGFDYVRLVHPEIKLPRIEEFQYGGIVGIAEIYGCVTRSENPWFMGTYGFLLRNAAPLVFRPVRGQLGFFDVELTATERTPA